MHSIVILCNGEFLRKAYPLYLLESAEAVIGEMDSLPRRLREKLAPIVIPVEEQDYNDLTKAMRYVLDHHPDVTDIHILGASGLREDHTVGNLGLLMEYTRMFDLEGIRVEMVSDYSTAFAITDSCELHVGKGRRVSLFSPDNSLTIKSEGLHWSTDEVVFDNWWPATLNRADADVIKLTFSHPSRALVILD